MLAGMAREYNTKTMKMVASGDSKVNERAGGIYTHLACFRWLLVGSSVAATTTATTTTTVMA